MAKKDSNAIATNRKARHDFFIEETYEAGLVLQGTEIKSIRAGRVNLKDAFARVSNGEVYVLTNKAIDITMNQPVLESCYFIEAKSTS